VCGFSLAELIVASALGAVVILLVGNFLTSSMKTGAFTEGQSATINDARNAMQTIEKEIRGADSITWPNTCSPVGNCLVVGAQTVSGGFRTVRYGYTSSALTREIFDPVAGTWGTAQPVIDRVANTSTQPLFSCDTQSSLLRVTVDLHISPTPVSNPSYNLQTSIRPRNFPSKAVCP
jgi:type II secretory pathway pseudopilin PulG